MHLVSCRIGEIPSLVIRSEHTYELPAPVSIMILASCPLTIARTVACKVDVDQVDALGFFSVDVGTLPCSGTVEILLSQRDV